MSSVDWERLRLEAITASRRAYAPYSGLSVGAAGLTSDGRVVSSCNVENASYGLTLCAECGLVSALHGSRTGVEKARLVAVSILAGDGAPLAPCGRCRQLLLEAGGPGLLIDAGDEAEPVQMSALLPAAFDADELEERRAESP